MIGRSLLSFIGAIGVYGMGMLAPSAHAQPGGLIKKKITQATGTAAVAGTLAGILISFLADEPGVQVYAFGAIQVRPSIHLEPDILVGNLPTVPRWDPWARR